MEDGSNCGMTGAPGTAKSNCSAITQYNYWQETNLDPNTNRPYLFGVIGNPHHMTVRDNLRGVVVFDSDPDGNWSVDCPNSEAIILLNPIGPPPPPPPPPIGGGGRRFSIGCCTNKVIV
jgi:hypothetical protein